MLRPQASPGHRRTLPDLRELERGGLPLDTATPPWYTSSVDEQDYPLLRASPEKNKPPTVIRLTRQEKILLDAYITYGSISAASNVAKIDPGFAARFIARPDIALYVSDKAVELAGAIGLTKEKVLSALHDLVDNPSMEATAAHTRALDMSTRILKLIQPPGTQVNVAIKNESGKLSDAELDAAWKAREEAMRTKSDVPAIETTQKEGKA